MATATRCDAVDFNGTQCGLMAGHGGQHAPAIAPAPTRQGTSFGRILATPLILVIAALLVGSVSGMTMPAVAIAAVVSIAYILWASRR